VSKEDDHVEELKERYQAMVVVLDTGASGLARRTNDGRMVNIRTGVLSEHDFEEAEEFLVSQIP